MLGAYSLFMYAQVWSKLNLENFISPIEGKVITYPHIYNLYHSQILKYSSATPG